MRKADRYAAGLGLLALAIAGAALADRTLAGGVPEDPAPGRFTAPAAPALPLYALIPPLA